MKGNYEKTILAEDDPCPENVETTKSETETALEDRARAMVLGFGIMLFYAPMLCKISKSRDIMQLYMKGRLNHEAITAKKRYGQRCGKSVDGGIDTVKSI